MTGLCKTCRHWRRNDDPIEWREREITEPEDPDTFEKMSMPFEVRLCQHPAMTRFERPVEINGFGLTDGSKYFAILVTAEEFGCVRHEP